VPDVRGEQGETTAGIERLWPDIIPLGR